MVVIRIGFFIYLWVTFSTLAWTQVEQTDSILFYQNLNLAKKEPDKAFFFLRKAEESAKTDYQRLKVNYSLALHYYLKKKAPDSALIQVQKNLTIDYREGEPKDYYKQLADSYRLIGHISGEGADYDKVLELMPKAIDLFKNRPELKQNISFYYLYISHTYLKLEDYENCELWCKKLVDYSSRIGFNRNVEDGYFFLAQLYLMQNKLSKAREAYKYILFQLDHENAGSWTIYLNTNNSLGSLFVSAGELDSAEVYFREVERYLKNEASNYITEETITYYKAVVFNNFGNLFTHKKDYTAALNYSNKSLELNEELFGKNSSQLIRNLKQIGKIYQNTHEYEKAESYLLRSLDISKKSKHDLVFSYSRLGDLYQMMKKLNKAELYYDSAVTEANIELKDYKDPKFNFRSRDALAALTGQIQIELKKQNNDMDEIDLLLDQLTHVAGLIYEETDSKVIFDRIPIALEGLYLIYSRSYDQTKDPRWLDRLWEISEINKSKKLRGQLKRKYYLANTLPKHLIDKQKQLNDSINLNTAILKPGEFDTTLFLLKERQENLMSKLKTEHPKYHKLISKPSPLKLTDRQKLMTKGELILSFTEGIDYVFLLKISQNTVEEFQFRKAEFLECMNKHNQGIFNNSSSQIVGASQALIKAFSLETDDLAEFDRIVIIPDGIIWNLNLAVLALGTEQRPLYLGNLYRLTYQYSSIVEKYNSERDSEKVLAFSFNEKSNQNQQSKPTTFRDLDTSLPGTSNEVFSISDIWEGKYFYAKAANETAFKEESTNYSILHLAIHGFQDESKPENSYLKFADADSLNDGMLHAYEIYNLDLNADLAVLSACHSGQGKVVAGEGMMSLGRAFAYAGVRSLLISRWEVSDYSAPHLMKYFYEGLKEGMYKSEALKYAQAKYLENHSDALTSSPFYWSSFYILGDDSPIGKPKAAFASWMIWLMIAVVTSAGLLYRRTKSTGQEQGRA